MFDKDNSDFVTKAMFKMLSSALNKEAFKAESERLKEAKEKYEIKTLFAEEELKEMAEIADKIISDKGFINVKNPYSSSIAAEILMTALIVKAAYYSTKEDKFDIIAALRELPFVLSFSSNNSDKGVELTDGEGSNMILLQDAGVELTYAAMKKYIQAIEYSISQATKTASIAYKIMDALKNDEVIKNAARDCEISSDADGKQ
ncbi:MAG: hypothetical protein LBO62_07330 [Endomicrobium sp.]|nr:hypothetical protein [Endomicrobium sp.]